MKPTTIDIYNSDPLTNAGEILFLSSIVEEVEKRGVSAVILANFHTKKGSRQIDCLVAVEGHAGSVDVKHLTGRVFGDQNNPWQIETSTGRRIPYEGGNPYLQARGAKFAISDDMHDFARSERTVPRSLSDKFYHEFDANVCLVPRLMEGSQVTAGDKKVHVRSYPEFVEDLFGQRLPSAWKLDDWRRFAQEFYGLQKVTLREAISPAFREAKQQVATYLTRFGEFYTTGLATVVEPPPESGTRFVGGQSLVEEIVQSGYHYLLLGPSGIGKTLHLRHAAVTAARNGWLPIWISAAHYKGDFKTLLGGSIAHCFTGSILTLLDAARTAGIPIFLVVDAFNGCAEDRKLELLQHLQAFLLREKSQVVISSTHPIALPPELQCKVIELSGLTKEWKRCLFTHYSTVAPNVDVDAFCAPFTTVMDIKLAAKCAEKLRVPVTRAALYSSYVRSVAKSPTVERRVFHAVAEAMGSGCCTALLLSDFERIAETTIEEAGAKLEIVDRIRSSRLLDFRWDYVAFSHELFLNFFRAESLARQHTDCAELAGYLAQPRNRGLEEFVLAMKPSARDVKALLESLADATLVGKALRGELGTVARKLVETDMAKLFREAEEDLFNITDAEIQFGELENGVRVPRKVKVNGAHEWSRYQVALMAVAASEVAEGAYVDQFLHLLTRTESTLADVVKKSGENGERYWRDLFMALFHYVGGNVCIPGARMFKMLADVGQNRLSAKGGASPLYSGLAEIKAASEQPPFTALYLLTFELRSRRPLDPNQLLRVFCKCWNSRVWPLQMEGLEMLQWVASDFTTSHPDELPRVKALLERLPTNNPMRNTVILETLAAFGFLEPPVTIEEALEEIQSVINPDKAALDEFLAVAREWKVEYTSDELLNQRADAIVGKMFEDVFLGTYYEAFEQLTPADQARLLSRAALVDQTGIFSDWTLLRLVELGDECAIPAFVRRATHIETDTVSKDDAASAYFVAIIGCAQFFDLPPQLETLATPNELAWQAVGELLFWHCKHGIDLVELTERAEAVWMKLETELQLAAIDPLAHLARCDARRSGARDTIAGFFEANTERMRSLLEHALVNRERLTTIFERTGAWATWEFVDFVIGQLGSTGTDESLALLRRYVDDPAIGNAVMDAIHSIERRLLPT
jgi:Nuclease-related domain